MIAPTGGSLDRDACYRALLARDARFDGRFYTGVRTTGIYCRPICPARTPKPENIVFLPSAAAAHRLGFRPCLRCRPEVAPGVAGWHGTASTVARALGLIAEGALDGDGDVDRLADRLGIGARHLRRLFDTHVGASPIAVAQTQRLLFAKALVSGTRLPMTEIALASGFGSLRRFNDAFRKSWGRSPSSLRGPAADAAADAPITLRLPHSGPLDWPALLDALARESDPAEQVGDGRWQRRFAIDGATGSAEVRLYGRHLVAEIRIDAVRPLGKLVARLRRRLDLDADVQAIDAQLALDPRLADDVAARPGLRVPGGWDAPRETALLGPDHLRPWGAYAALRLAGPLARAA